MHSSAAEYRRYRIRSFVILWFVYGGYYLTRKNYAVAKSGIMDEFNLDTAQLGVIGGTFLATYAVGQFVSGALGDRVGARVMLAVGMIGSALMSIWFGFAPSVVYMTALWAANGLFQSTGWSASVKSMTQWFSLRERGVVMGFWCTCYQIGSALAAGFAAWALGKWGLRSAFTAPALFLLAIAVVYVLFHKDSPEKVGLPPIVKRSGGGTEGKTETTDATAGRPEDGSIILKVLSHPMVWMMGISYFCLKFVRYSLLMWLPFYMTKELGYEASASGVLSAIPEFAGFAGAIFAGYVSDRFFGSRRAPICALMFAGLAAACVFQSRLCLAGAAPMVAGLSVIYFMIFGPDTIMTGAAAMDFGAEKGAATAAGFINGCGSIGAAIQEPLLGYLALRFGYDYFFYIFIPLSIIPFLIMLTQWGVRAKQE